VTDCLSITVSTHGAMGKCEYCPARSGTECDEKGAARFAWVQTSRLFVVVFNLLAGKDANNCMSRIASCRFQNRKPCLARNYPIDSAGRKAGLGAEFDARAPPLPII